MIERKYQVLLLLFLCSFTTSFAYAETVEISTFRENALSRKLAHIMRTVYHRAGIRVNIEFLPAARSLAMSSTGSVDGELGRIYAIGEKYPDLIRVKTSLMKMRGMAFVTDKSIKYKDWLDLKIYRFGILRGSVFAADITKGFEREYANSPDQLVKMLQFKRIDIIASEETIIRDAIARNKLESSIVALYPPLTERPLYHYIHKSKSHLVPTLEKILAEMEATGELKSLGLWRPER